jgi:hypothetical protein
MFAALGPVERQQLSLLRPEPVARREDVRRARVCPGAVVAGRTDDRRARPERDTRAEVISQGPIERKQLLLLQPEAAAPHEEVRRAGLTVAERRSNQHGVLTHGDRESEATGARVDGDEFLLQVPAALASQVDVGRTGVYTRVVLHRDRAGRRCRKTGRAWTGASASVGWSHSTASEMPDGAQPQLAGSYHRAQPRARPFLLLRLVSNPRDRDGCQPPGSGEPGSEP